MFKQCPARVVLRKPCRACDVEVAVKLGSLRKYGGRADRLEDWFRLLRKRLSRKTNLSFRPDFLGRSSQSPVGAPSDSDGQQNNQT